ncbi:CaiB/BaiF CoA transferase family protein [Amycolatopsis alba]|uniref:CoA transferase n=1 Tax=Amycolatopsis alba DSM 44262 TaxID=1125972 RepID=A0A229RQC6_AMYAL|nr:CaiB/BaiF CoA-transferase family protein [Amycolatopsis alba]OXM48853.1 CoA transferase [Amycolatopsis alba DSM 44262]
MTGGPLAGLRVIELGGLGPGPFCGMLLADLGADVVRVDRPGGVTTFHPYGRELLNRGKRSVLADLKTTEGKNLVLSLADHADLFIEGFRPGVVEKLGVGPEECLRRNPTLVYGRVTGWGQAGPLAGTAGHDITYIAPTGVLHAIGSHDGPPQIPLGLIGDFAGGLYLAVGLLSGLHEARNGQGQVVDAAMCDGAAHLMTMFYGLLGSGAWEDRRGTNLFDGGAPFYGVYETRDGEYMAVGAVEAEFFHEFAERLGIDGDVDHLDRGQWEELRETIATRFQQRTRAEWMERFEGSDACVAPVLSMTEAPEHPHLQERGSFVTIDGVTQPASSPRFSRTATAAPRKPPIPGTHTAEVIKDWLGPRHSDID